MSGFAVGCAVLCALADKEEIDKVKGTRRMSVFQSRTCCSELKVFSVAAASLLHPLPAGSHWFVLEKKCIRPEQVFFIHSKSARVLWGTNSSKSV